MKKTYFIFVPVIIAVIAVAGLMLIHRAPDQVIIGGDSDEHGCIGSAGYLWCEARQECLRIWETKCDDAQMEFEISTFVSDLGDQLGINFGEQLDASFEWFTEQDGDYTSEAVQALSYTIDPVSDEVYSLIRTTLMDFGFENDQYNVSSGTVVGAEGFKRGITVCQLRYELKVDANGIDEFIEGDLNDYPRSLTLTCGLLDEIGLDQ
ncbi:hypothetical protein KKH24_00490 [Patescibacteria group bacterium]|nr:hypothetical protein [Patescibacteria group bacterium]